MTRQEYMEANSAAFDAHPNDRAAQKAATCAAHRAYYAQYVTPGLTREVAHWIGEDKLRASGEEHLNDIPLARWDVLANMLRFDYTPKLRALGDTWSGVGGVCVLKEAARQWLEVNQ